jgi:hypothetical protein
MTDYRNVAWWGWSGGDCPVQPDDVVDLCLKDAGLVAGKRASSWSWLDARIAAFRVVREAPRVWWLNEYPHGEVAGVFDSSDEADRYADSGRVRKFKVQEVKE